MADISDITAYLKAQCIVACYPGGAPSGPSPVCGLDVLVMEGWPIPEKLDLDLTGRMLNAQSMVVPRPGGVRANVSVFPMPGMNVVPFQILDDIKVITYPTFGLSISISESGNTSQDPTVGNVFTIQVNGTPGPSEFLTVEIDNNYIATAGGTTAGAICAALAAQIGQFSPVLNGGGATQYAATANGFVLTITGAAYVTPRLGATGLMGKVTHRQRQFVSIDIWAPDHNTRTSLGKAIDGFLKQNTRVQMPDTSEALILYNRTNVIDELEPVACYRRGLIYQVEYATLETFPGVVVTSASVSIQPVSTDAQGFPAGYPPENFPPFAGAL